MQQYLVWRSRSRSLYRAMAAAISILTMSVWFAPAAQAQDSEARKILKAMSDYVTSQQTLSLTFDTDIEVITPDLQKIQFTSSGKLQLSRPDKLRVTRTGGYADVEMVFDGSTLSVLGKNINAFTQLDAPGSVDQLIDRLRTGSGIGAPGADLILSNVYDVLSEDIIDAKYIWPRGDRRRRLRAPGVSQLRGRLAALGGGRRAADPAQICDHQQDGDRGTPVHASNQGMAVGCAGAAPTLSSSSRRKARTRSGRTRLPVSTRSHPALSWEEENDARGKIDDARSDFGRRWRRRSALERGTSRGTDKPHWSQPLTPASAAR